jgi:hypothetical protein
MTTDADIVELSDAILAKVDIPPPAAWDAACIAVERLRAVPAPGWADAIEQAANLLDLRRHDILLIAGEMTEQEICSVRAMLNERARAIRALSPPPSEAVPSTSDESREQTRREAARNGMLAGRNEGIAAAAAVAFSFDSDEAKKIARAIRSLSPPQEGK